MVYKHVKTTTANRGFAIIVTTVILAFTLTVGVSLLAYVGSTKKSEFIYKNEIDAIQAAQAGLDKAIFCLNAANGESCGGFFGLTYTGETDVTIGSAKFTTSIVGAGSERTITSVGTSASGLVRTIQSELTSVPAQDDVSFGYALQSGDGGAHLENNASINGTLYSGGDVTCQTTQAEVDGDVFVSLLNGKIDKCTVNYNAYADRILNSDVSGNAYYRFDPADINGSHVDGIKFPGSTRPESISLPELDIELWHESAENGGIVAGPFSPPDNSNLGPIKILGDLVIGNNVDLTITGPVWVVGNVITGNVSSIRLAPEFNEFSTVILADDPANPDIKGKIDITNNTVVSGSGNPNSHVLFVSTNTSINTDSPALQVANNSDGAVFMATQGALKLSNRAGAKSLAAYRLLISQLASVNYVESELADAKFSNSPGGTWRVVPGTWRQVK